MVPCRGPMPPDGDRDGRSQPVGLPVAHREVHRPRGLEVRETLRASAAWIRASGSRAAGGPSHAALRSGRGVPGSTLRRRASCRAVHGWQQLRPVPRWRCHGRCALRHGHAVWRSSAAGWSWRLTRSKRRDAHACGCDQQSAGGHLRRGRASVGSDGGISQASLRGRETSAARRRAASGRQRHRSSPSRRRRRGRTAGPGRPTDR